MTEDDDARLLGTIRQGETCAVTTLVRRWENRILRIAYRVTGDHTEAEDVRQEVFLRLLGATGTIRRPDRLAAWIRRATVNAAITAVRRRTRWTKAVGALARAADPAQPSERLESVDDAERLARALQCLAPSDRALLSLKFDEELTFEEIVASLGKPASTLKSRYQRAVRKLRHDLESHT